MARVAELPDDNLSLPATPGVVGVLEGRQCAPNGGLSIPPSVVPCGQRRWSYKAAMQPDSMLDDAPIEH